MTVKAVLLIVVCVILVGSVLVPFCIPDDDDHTLDVIVIDGQSNAQYWGWYTNLICSPTVVNESGLEAPNHDLYYYGDSTPTYYGETYVTATYDTTLESYDLHPMYEDGAWTIGGYGPVMARALSERSGHDVLVIDVGVGAAPISWLTSTGPGGIYADRVIAAALAKVPSTYHIDMLGMVWAQGEADSSTSVDTYVEQFNLLYDDFSEKFGIQDVYIIKTRDEYGGNAITAQEQLAESNEHISIAYDDTDSFTTENGYLRPDGIHYSQTGRSLIASVLGEVIEYNEHDAGRYTQLLLVVPAMIIIALLLGVVALVLRSRMD